VTFWLRHVGGEWPSGCCVEIVDQPLTDAEVTVT
jgi:hypothetical protein